MKRQLGLAFLTGFAFSIAVWRGNAGADEIRLTAQPKPAPSVDVYVLATSGTSASPCSRPSSAELHTAEEAIVALIMRKLGPNVSVKDRTANRNINILASPAYTHLHPRINVAIATVCKALDVYTITINGYALPALAPPPATTPKPTATQQVRPTPSPGSFDALIARLAPGAEGTAQGFDYLTTPTETPEPIKTGSQSGTFEALEAHDSAGWANLFGAEKPAPLVPNVRFSRSRMTQTT